MSDFLRPWLPRRARDAALTLALAVFCLAAVSLSRPSAPAPVAAAPAVAASAVAGTDLVTEWPRTAMRLWFILPRFLSP